MTCVIYRIVNGVNGKLYVGSAVNFDKRRKSHLKMLRLGTHHSVKLQNAWNKYGADAFVFEIIAIVDKKESLIPAEQFYIDLYDSFNVGYNCAPKAGSQLGMIHSEETLKKLSMVNKGRKFSDEHRLKISQSNKGRNFSEETRKKMSLAKKNRSAEDNLRCMETMRSANIGRKHSKELTERAANNLRGKPRPEYVREKLKKAWIERRKRGTSEETRKKISLAGMGRKHSEETKKKMSVSAKIAKQKLREKAS